MSETKRDRQEARAPFDMSACIAMMEKMVAQAREGFDCSDMISEISSMEGVPEEWMKVMSQMMEFYCGEPRKEVTENL